MATTVRALVLVAVGGIVVTTVATVYFQQQRAEEARVRAEAAAEEDRRQKGVQLQKLMDDMAAQQDLLARCHGLLVDAGGRELPPECEPTINRGIQIPVSKLFDGGGGGTRRSPPCNCEPGDPLCSCL